MKIRHWLMAGLLGVNIVLAGGLAYRAGGWRTSIVRAQPNLQGGHYLVVSTSDNFGGTVYVFNPDTGVIGGWVTPASNPQHPVFIVPRNVTRDVRRVRQHLR